MFSLPLPLAAFFAGLLSFLSPCVLPLVPGYVSLISGSSIEALQRHEQGVLRRVMINSIMFVVGFSLVFISLGAVATGIGQMVRQFYPVLTRIAGALIILFGLHLTGIVRINALFADKRLHQVKGGGSAWGAFVVGFAFAFGWTPCIGPILATILALAAAESTVLKGTGLLAIYSLGLAVPFLFTSLGIDRFLSFYSRFRQHLHMVEILSGSLLIVIGTLILTRHFTVLSGYLGFLNRFSL